MARGWESKSVEQQQDQAESNAAQKGVRLTPAQMALEQRRRGLELSRQRVLQQLKTASNPRHRQLLQRTLADLDRAIQDLERDL